MVSDAAPVASQASVSCTVKGREKSLKGWNLGKNGEKGKKPAEFAVSKLVIRNLSISRICYILKC